MKLTGNIYKDNIIIKTKTLDEDSNRNSIRDILEELLILTCKDLDIQVPMWFDRNTKEFGAFKKTSFFKDQFIENVDFTRFEIILDQ
ncbi:MAG: hypothetical protein ABF289_06360 [Clostridiales bacterium]